MVQYCLSRSNRRRAIDFTLKKMTVEKRFARKSLLHFGREAWRELPREASAEVSLLVQLYYCILG